MDYKQLFPFTVNHPLRPVKNIEKMTKYGYIDNGVEYLDLGLGSSGCFPLGFMRKDLLTKVTEKLYDTPFCQSDFVTTNRYVDECSQKLYDVSGGYRSIFSLSGSDSIEGAVKLVRMYWQGKKEDRTEIFGFQYSYHGSTYMSSSLADAEYMTDIFGKHPDCKTLPTPKYKGHADPAEQERINLEELRSHITEKTAAVFIESVSWDAGLWPISKNWWAGLRKICDETGALLVVDDIAFCAGKTGTLFGWQPFEVKPDIFCIGKGIGGGYWPVSATLMNEKVYQSTATLSLMHGFSYSFPMGGIISILEFIKIIEEENLLENHSNVLDKMNSLVVKPLLDKNLISNSRNFGICFNLTPVKDLGAFDEKDALLYENRLHMGLWNSHRGGILLMVPLDADEEYFAMLLERLEGLLTNDG